MFYQIIIIGVPAKATVKCQFIAVIKPELQESPHLELMKLW